MPHAAIRLPIEGDGAALCHGWAGNAAATKAEDVSWDISRNRQRLSSRTGGAGIA
jgi:hypothetical protein